MIIRLFKLILLLSILGKKNEQDFSVFIAGLYIADANKTTTAFPNSSQRGVNFYFKFEIKKPVIKTFNKFKIISIMYQRLPFN